MGYFSQLAIDNENIQRFDRDGLKYVAEDINKRIPPKVFLEYQLNLLLEKLEDLEHMRPHDPMHPDFDRMFYSRFHCHYYENPQTAREILSAISEVNTCLDVLEQKAALEWKDSDYQSLRKNLPQQILLSGYWDYSFLFPEVESYYVALPVITRCA